MCVLARPAFAGQDVASSLRYVEDNGFIEVREGDTPVLRYSYGSTPVPEGIGGEFARGDYVSALFGLDGELLTEDYPKDHPHHRAVNWSWATVRWKGEMRDLFAVRGIWARPASKPHVITDSSGLSIAADSVWQWDDKIPVVAESVTIRAYPKGVRDRTIDFDIRLVALVDGLEFCGRLEAGYSGFNVRMAPATGQDIVFHTDPPDAKPRRAWADYSAEFPRGKGRSGLAILQRADDPLYPQEWRQYPNLNFFQPIYPGGSPIPLLKEPPLALHYRLWIHRGGADAEALAQQWDRYNAKETK